MSVGDISAACSEFAYVIKKAFVAKTLEDSVFDYSCCLNPPLVVYSGGKHIH